MDKFIRKHPIKAILFVSSFSIIITCLLVELILRTFLPYSSIVTIGHINSENATKYGWGYNPHELVKIGNPDTGEVYDSLTNNHGWRDKDRDFINHRKSYRILVLGDSNTFGAIVPADKIYTRILEDRLNAEGFNVEVISIAYGAWGTDQQIEALRNEGLKYNPDLIIIQFSTNDLSENTYFHGQEKGLKPFYYDIDNNGNLVRYENQFWIKKNLEWKYKALFAIAKSEILKRIYGLYKSYRVTKLSTTTTRYTINRKKINKLSLMKQINPEFFDYLENHIDKNTDKAELIKAINLHKQGPNKETILRVLEFRWFNEYWSEKSFIPKPSNADEPQWKLYFALLMEAHKMAKEAGANLAVFSDNEIGHYEWATYWYRIKDDEEAKSNYLSPTRIIKAFSKENGIDFIENVHKHIRARNDPHPNIEGNYAMAANIYEYLITHHKSEIALLESS